MPQTLNIPPYHRPVAVMILESDGTERPVAEIEVAYGPGHHLTHITMRLGEGPVIEDDPAQTIIEQCKGCGVEPGMLHMPKCSEMKEDPRNPLARGGEVRPSHHMHYPGEY